VRIGLIYVAQETNDFNPLPTTLADYRAFGLYEGEAIPRLLGGIGQIGGHYAAVAESGMAVETVPILRAFTVAGGRISREAFDHFAARIAAWLRAAGPLDGLALQLHGACAADGEDDVEGAQAELCRSILGPHVPIVLGLDHHANLTRRMVAAVDAIVAHRTQPHDTFDTGRVGTALLLRILRGEVRPVMAWRKIPMVTHQEQFLTSGGPMKTWFDRARAMEAADPRVLQAVPLPMQPWLDVAEGGWSCVVVTDGERALAERLADELADLAWSLREGFLVKDAVAVDEAVRRADAAPRGVVVLSDTGDTVFGGSSGDSNVILEAMLRLGIRGPAAVPMISPAAAARLHAAGVGAEVTLPLGGDAATAFFRPLTVTGRVRFVGEGPVPVSGYMHQSHVDMGRRAVLDVGPVHVLVTELRGVAGNLPDVWTASGVDIAACKMAVLKTASNFQFFTPISSQLIRVGSPGPGQSDLMTLPWRRLPRPIWPLDARADWRG
jgi:microcystin degradation protein MlrC